MNKTNLFGVVLLTGLCCASFADAQILLSENFDTTAVGGIPNGWTRSQPANTTVGVTDTVSVSAPNSLELTDTVSGGGTFPAATASFATISSGLVYLDADMRTTTAVGDPLVIKLRNTLNQDLGGVRFNPNGSFGYLLANGGWQNTAITFSINTWYSVEMEYNLDTQTYSAWVDGANLVTDAAFRSTTLTINAANLLVQAYPNIGTGSSFVDNVVVAVPEPPIAAALIGLLPLIAARLRKRRR